MVHEYTHLSEGSEEYAKLVDFLSSDNVLVDDGNGGKVELWKKGQESVFEKNYGFDRETIQEIHDKIANEQELTADEQKYFKDFMSEVGAHETEYLLGNEEFIDRIVARDSSFAKKFFQKIENLRKAFERVGDKEARKAYKQIHEAEKLYLKAAAKAGDMKLVKFILSRNPDLEKEIDVSSEIKYNKKAKYLNISKQEYAIIGSRIMEDNSRIVARNQELPRYGKARSSNYFYVYENFAIGNFGVLKQIEITDSNREYIASIEERLGGDNGKQTIGSTSELNRLLKVLKTRTRYNYSDNAYDSERRADSKNGGVSFGQSESERIGNAEKGDGNKRVKYSLKDNEYLSAVKNGDLKTAQRFVDEAARKSGYTIKAYHGTLAENFTEFKKSFIGSRFSFDEKGFFFIDRKSIAEDYARSEFDSSKKKYFVEAQKKTVNYNGQNIPLLQAMYLYMAISDSDTIPSLAKSGFVYNDGEREVRVNGFAQNEDIEVGEMQAMAKEIQSSLEKQFSTTDKEYIEIARKIFNEECRKRYTETSIILKGYSNAKEGDYVPIRRANVAKNVDTSTLEYEINRASNASFTKDRVKGATSELRVEGIDSVVDRHVRAIAQYANLAPAIEEYNKLFNLNTVKNNGKPISVLTESRNVWAKGDEYFRQLISDIQGVPTMKGVGNKAMSFIRGGYAKYQLGANPKVWVTQLSSFFASGSVLDYSSIVKGVGINTSDVDKYCQLAQLRNNDNTAAMAQGVLDKVDKFGSVLMKPIGTVDRFVVKKLFGACQVQVQKDNGLKIGTEENKVKAGELLKNVILETQQNSMATERSAAMRSGSEFMRTITMFSADSMKVIGRVIDSIDFSF